jgi:hypothetical protein
VGELFYNPQLERRESHSRFAATVDEDNKFPRDQFTFQGVARLRSHGCEADKIEKLSGSTKNCSNLCRLKLLLPYD